MRIISSKLTGTGLMQKACSFTIDKESKATLADMYRCEHSPIRTQIFCVEMYNIPTFVSVHLVRHNVGVSHFVKSNREDRPGYTGDTGRDHPVNHMMIVNAQALINMSRKRLCRKSHDKTIEVWEHVKDSLQGVDPDLCKRMVKDCEYRNGCYEKKPCGYWYNEYAEAN